MCVYENLEKLVFVIGSTWSTYPLVNYDNYGKSPLFIDKSTINRPLPIATSNYQRVPLVLIGKFYKKRHMFVSDMADQGL